MAQGGPFTTLDDLASQYGGSIRGNEGEAAEYGVYYDDTEYDYMQHLRDLGEGGGEAHWVESKASQSKKQGKKRQDLAVALRDMDIAAEDKGENEEDEAPSLVPASIPTDARSAYTLPSWVSEKSQRDRIIESQLDVPSDIAGFQPDMDSRLREALEALEDDAYVDGEDEDDTFGALSGEGVEVSLDEFERLGDFMIDEEEDGWESDDTVKAANETSTAPSNGGVSLLEVQHPADSGAIPGEVEADAEEGGAWLSEFSKFKKDQKSAPAVAAPSTLMTGASSKLWELPDAARKKKRKGALTETSSYSMTSSSLFRNDNQNLLDRRFDKLEADYAADAADDYDEDDSMSMASGMTGLSKMSGISAASGFSSASRASAMSQQPKGLRSDFDNIMDDFLGPSRGSTAAASPRGGKSNRNRTGAGLEQLDEIRKGLGPARLSRSAQKAT